MKMMLEQNPKPTAEQPVFYKVAENLFRLESSGVMPSSNKAASNFVARSKRRTGGWRTAA
jgi:hypothetical protein